MPPAIRKKAEQLAARNNISFVEAASILGTRGARKRHHLTRDPLALPPRIPCTVAERPISKVYPVETQPTFEFYKHIHHPRHGF